MSLRFFTLPRPRTETLAPAGGASPLGRLTSLDVVVGVYVLATAAIVLLDFQQIPGAATIALLHLAGLVVYVLLRYGSTDGIVLRVLFVISLIALVLGIFEGMGAILPHLRADVVADRKADRWLAGADVSLFGSDPTRWFSPVLAPWSVLVLQICYASYFFIAPTVAFVLLWRGRYRSFLSWAAVIIGCFFTTYVGYYLVPAYGPRTFNHYTTPIPHHAVSRAIYDVIDSLDYIHLNAFPSGHTAVALVCLAALFYEARRLAWVFLPLVAGLIVATVALRYHYLVDVLAGILVAAIWIPWGARVAFVFDHRPVAGR